MQGSTQTCYHSPRLHANPTTSSNLSLNRQHCRQRTLSLAHILCRCSPRAPPPIQPLDGLQLRVRVFGCFVVGGRRRWGGGGGGRLATRDSTNDTNRTHTTHTHTAKSSNWRPPTRGGKLVGSSQRKSAFNSFKHSPIAATKKGKCPQGTKNRMRKWCAALCVCAMLMNKMEVIKCVTHSRRLREGGAGHA